MKHMALQPGSLQTFPRIVRAKEEHCMHFLIDNIPCFRTFLLCTMVPGLTATVIRGFLKPRKVGV
jgi:hypothetical protein